MTVHLGHRDVAHDELGAVAPGEFHALPPVARLGHRKSFQCEQRGKLLSQPGFVFNHKDPLHSRNVRREFPK
jgi:hypothetical protein